MKLLNNGKMSIDELKDIYMNILLFSIIAFSRDTLIGNTILGFYVTWIVFVAINLPIILIILKDKKIQLRPTILLMILICLVLLSMAIKGDFQLVNFSFILAIICGYLTIYVYDFKTFSRKLINLMYFLCLYSLITTYVIKPLIIKSGIDFFYIINPANYKFMNFGLSFAMMTDDYIRNFGIFREPGVYQFYILIPLILILFYEKDYKKLKYILVYSITIVSTFSTTGLIVLICIMLIYFIRKRKIKFNFKKILIILLIFIALAYIFNMLYNNNENFRESINWSFEKLDKDNKNASSTDRFDSIKLNMQQFLESPIYGNKAWSTDELVDNNTNTTFTILSVYGLFLGILHVFLLCLFLKKMNINYITLFGILIVILMSINAEYFFTNPLLWTISFAYFMKEGKNNNENSLDS